MAGGGRRRTAVGQLDRRAAAQLAPRLLVQANVEAIELAQRLQAARSQRLPLRKPTPPAAAFAAAAFAASLFSSACACCCSISVSTRFHSNLFSLVRIDERKVFAPDSVEGDNARWTAHGNATS